MQTIKFVQNGRGERVPEAVRSTQGLSLFNANGDVADSSTGFKYATDTLTWIKQEVSLQKFYKVPPANYMPVMTGRGGYADQIITNLAFTNGGDFGAGIINTGSNTRFANVDASVSQKTQKVALWAKQLTYNIIEVQQALEANNWDPIMAKELARKENFDLGIQSVAFLGLPGDAAITGLLNNPDVTINTSLITGPISSKNAAAISTFVQTLISTYFTATNSTQMPDTFAIPYSDFLGLSVPFAGTVGTYPLPLFDYLLMAFKSQTQNDNFRILPLAYAEAANNAAAGINKQCYALYNNDSRSLAMEVPIPYQTTAVNSINNFSFQNVGYARFTGLGVFRNLELLYFQY